MGTLRIEGLRKTYGKVAAVDGLDLAVADGEFFVLVGPSGAGKTTTLKSVGGLQEIDAGSIHIDGIDMTDVEPYHRNVAMAFESYALYPQDTVFDNLASPLRSGRTGKYSRQDIAQRIELVTRTLGIDALLKRFPRELSNGQRQRVALGRVLVRPADVYLLDEPLSHLDAKLRAAMRIELKSLGALSSTTSLYVTHDYQEALALGDRIGVLRAGRLLQVGPPAEVWSEPADTFVARTLGQPEINLLDAEVHDGHAVAAGGAVRLPLTGRLPIDSGDPVRIGVRPRDLTLHDGRSAPDRLTIEGRVELAERLGRAVELTVRVGDERLIVVAPSDISPPEGRAIAVGVSLDNVHLFAAPGHSGADSPRLGSPVGARTPAGDRPGAGTDARSEVGA